MPGRIDGHIWPLWESMSELVCPKEVSGCLRCCGAGVNSREMGASECNLMEQLFHPALHSCLKALSGVSPFLNEFS